MELIGLSIARFSSISVGCHPLDVDFTVLSGKQDEDTQEEVEAWRIHTTGNCDIHYFEGDHFFIHDETEKVLNVINNAVRKAVG